MTSSEPELYLRVPRFCEVRRWGPTWAEMKETALWLAESGVAYQFDIKALYAQDEEYGLPAMVVYDARWDWRDVRVGDLLVKYGDDRVEVVAKGHFKEDFEPAQKHDIEDAA